LRIRAQALSWLKAELVEYSKLLDSGKSPDRAGVGQQRLDVDDE
jgi:hypothetical protein